MNNNENSPLARYVRQLQDDLKLAKERRSKVPPQYKATIAEYNGAIAMLERILIRLQDILKLDV